jgi:hypothetical protein
MQVLLRSVAVLGLLGSLSAAALAQAAPIGRSHRAARPLAEIPRLAVPALDRAAIAAEDAARDDAGRPPRFALPFDVRATPATHGHWDELGDGWSLWRLRVLAPGASHVNLGFTRFWLPPGAALRIHSADQARVVRPFGAADNSAARELWTPVVPGEEVVIELHVRTGERERAELELGRVGSGYRFFGAGRTATDLAPLGGSCNIDVICPDGDGWRSEIPAVAAYSTGGSVFCTGFMVNNTARDARSFFMTAFHCGITASNAASLVVYWNYDNTVCRGIDDGQFDEFNTGAVFRAGHSRSDFTLVELNNPPDPNWGVTLAGWDRTGVEATSAVAIHHPSGCPKKISFEDQPTATTSYGGTTSPGDGTHVRVIDWDRGTTEPGSSGSPLFDQNHRVIGQLHGGGAACGNDLSDWYGKFAVSWTGGGTNATRLSGWLDPLGTGETTLDTFAAQDVARAIPYGVGCYQRFASFHESFSINGFDLAGSASSANAIRLRPTAAGYTVEAAPSAWFTPLSANLGLGDDALSGPLTLPFTFAHPGGSTTRVRVCSNGFVWLDGSTANADYDPNAAALVSLPARLCPVWMDLDPSSGGTIHYDVDASQTAVYVTWVDVVEFSTSSANTLQCVLRADGSVEFRWRVVRNIDGRALVGYSPGGGAALPGSTDISAAIPFATSADLRPLTLRATSRPQLGTVQTFSVDNIPAGSSSGALCIGLTKLDPGTDLGVIGMPECRLHGSLEVCYNFTVAGSSATSSFNVPVDSSIAGLHLYAQALTITPGFNVLGLLASNGVDLKLDLR